ncbi:methyl-accepting chemotaxis protein [uncultured Desulfuromusa sp.]|uniref:methyl-accepting chemotaxis protein n=1 Tax=uncultured Desulfuromusa sp. TaxID=219183 RepID=UPI002AA67759|nr:methyl-accepting chemotaxis protein [uncultured Desulfuromusa sp.]
MRWTLRLRNRLLLSITSVMVIGMLITSAISYICSKNAIREAVGHSMTNTVATCQKQIASWVNDVEADLQNLGYNSLVSNILQNQDDPVNTNDLLQKFKNDYPFYENLGILNKQGLLIAGSNPKLVGKLELKDRTYFRKAMAGQAALSKPVASRDTGEPIFVIAVPIKEDRQIKGALFAAVALSGFSKTFIDPLKIGKNGYAFVTDSDGVLIAHPDKQRILKVNTRDYQIGKEMMKTENMNQIVSYELDGEEKILSFGIDNKTGWTVGVTASPEDIYSSAYQVRNINIVSTCILALVVALSLFLLVTPVVSALNKGVNLAKAVQQGETSLRIEIKRGDELGQLGNALNDMAASLEQRAAIIGKVADGDFRVRVPLLSSQDTLGLALEKMLSNLDNALMETSITSQQVASGSDQISGAAQTLSQGGAETAASLEEITATVTQLASQSNSNANKAMQARDLTSAAQNYAEQVNSQMEEMVQAMDKIQTSSQNISKIIKTIDEIAFQTNLLALNAAVEAARAGQHGKGFAVVAEEVRNLAARSAKAAEETAELIKGAVVLTAAGAETAEHTSNELTNIVTEINKVSGLVAEIAMASEEQAGGITQMNIGLEQIDRSTQQNMSMAEESAAAAEELSSQSSQLQAMLKQFLLTDRKSLPIPKNRLLVS